MRWRRKRLPRKRESTTLKANRVFAPMNFAMYGLTPSLEYRDGDDLLYIPLGADSCSFRLRVEHQRALVEGAHAPPSA